MLNKQNKRELIYGLPVIFFICLFLFGKIGIYNDTAQYIAMHIHRDPLYCLFLWLFRTISNDAQWYIRLVVFLQNAFAAVAVIKLSRTIRRIFNLNLPKEIVVCLLILSPHIITPIVASSGLILTNSVMSEGITFSLFYIFAACMTEMIAEVSKVSTWNALVFALLLSLARGQLMVMLIAWVVVAVYMCIVGKNTTAFIEKIIKEKKKVLTKALGCTAMIIVFLFTFALRGVIVKSYNLAFNNYYMQTTMSDVSLLANILYASDAESIELISDEETKQYATAAFEMADSLGYNYKYTDKGFLNRAADLENTHDRIKFECIDECWRHIHDAMGGKYQFDYEFETSEQDRIAGNVISEIFSKCIGVWLYDYLALATVGFIRTVAYVNPVFNVYALLIYLIWIGSIVCLIVRCFRKRKNNRTINIGADNNSITNDKVDREILIIRFSLMTLLLVLGNVLATAIVIMCLSRYMIYMLPLVYISLFLLIDNYLKNKKDGIT